jgi:hypothetical protein
MGDSIITPEIQDILTGPGGEYAYLFPYRKETPVIKQHIFTDLKQSNKRLDELVVQNMLDIDNIGWTAKYILNLELFPYQIAILQLLWKTPLPIFCACRGGAKSFTLATYAILRALLDQGSKVVIVGAGLRQAKIVFSYIESIWSNAPVLRSIVGGGRNDGPRQNVDLCYFRVGQSRITALPLGTGEKIRGFRATTIIADEFSSIPEDIFNVVVQGFASTTKTPVDEAKSLAIEKRLRELNVDENVRKQIITPQGSGNQIIRAGTAYYQFNHFAQTFEKWRQIIESRGDPVKTSEIFGGPGNVPKDFNHKDYAIVRIPSSYLPEGLLDRRMLSNAKATLPKNIYDMEYNAIFIKDSDGYFVRSLIESCTTTPSKSIPTPDGEVIFTPMMRGIRGRKYVIGIDPGAESDRFGITIIEVWPGHYRIVYCWAINKPEFNKKKKGGLIDEKEDYYEYCCARIRSLIKLFEPIRIEMDSQGCGYPISEMLRSKKGLNTENGDVPIYEIVDPEDLKPTDGETDGPHILHLVQQSNEFNAYANAALHKSFETRRLLFPAFDVVAMQSALIAEKALNIGIDTYEECIYNIEELKNEICTIQRTETATGKDKFDTPSTVTSAVMEGRQKKGRLRKDRYTSLLIGHKFIYSTDVAPVSSIDYADTAGNFKLIQNLNPNEGMYRGPGCGLMEQSNKRSYNNALGAIKKGKKV